MVAKIGSDLDKPNGLVVVPPGTELDVLHPLPVTRLGGVGPATAERLHQIGVKTVGDLAAKSLTDLVALAGRAHGAGLYALARAEDDRAVVPDREAKSVSHEETFERDLTDLAVLGREIDSMAARVGTRLRASAFSGRTVTLKLRRYDFTTLTRSQTLPQPTDDTAPDRRDRPPAARRRRCRGRPAAARRRRVRACRSTRRATCSPRMTNPLPAVVTAEDAPEAVPVPDPPAERALVAGPGRAARGARAPAGCGAAGWGGSPSGSRARRPPRGRCAPWPPTTRPAARRSARLEDALVTERSWWGWGTTDRALPDDECVAFARRCCRGCPTAAPRPALADLVLPAAADRPRRVVCRSPSSPAVRAAHTYGKAYRDVVRALSGDLAAAPDAVAFPRTEADVVAAARLGRRRPASPSSPSAAAAPWSAVSSTAATGRWRLAGPTGAGPGAGGRPGQPGRPDPGRRARAGAGGAAAPARADAAALPAELRVLHARRLARHPRRRPLRHPAHPHRRPRRVDAGRDAGRDQRVVAAARLGRRALARPAVPRLGGDPRRHHRGLDAGAGPAAVQGVGVGDASPT